MIQHGYIKRQKKKKMQYGQVRNQYSITSTGSNTLDAIREVLGLISPKSQSNMLKKADFYVKLDEVLQPILSKCLEDSMIPSPEAERIAYLLIDVIHDTRSSFFSNIDFKANPK